MNTKKVYTLILTCFLVCVSCENYKEPSLSSAQKSWKSYTRTVDTDDPNYPLEVVEDGYKMIRVYKTQAIKATGTEIPSTTKVEWGWKYVVKNKYSSGKWVTVVYVLKDDDGFEVTSDNAFVYIDHGQTETILETSTMDYDNVDRVKDSYWTISYSK